MFASVPFQFNRYVPLSINFSGCKYFTRCPNWFKISTATLASSARVSDYLVNNIYSDITHAPTWGKPQLECAVKALGAKNVLFGTSYPLRKEWLLYGVDYILDLDISTEDKALILGGNAQRLFQIEG